MHTVVGCALGVPLRVHVHGEKQRGARASLGCLPWRRHARDQHIQVAIQRVAPHHAGGRLLAGAWCARRRAWAPDVAQRAGAGTPVDVHGQAAPRCARRSSCCVEASLRVLRRSGGRVRAALEGSAKEAQVASARRTSNAAPSAALPVARGPVAHRASTWASTRASEKALGAAVARRGAAKPCRSQYTLAATASSSAAAARRSGTTLRRPEAAAGATGGIRRASLYLDPAIHSALLHAMYALSADSATCGRPGPIAAPAAASTRRRRGGGEMRCSTYKEAQRAHGRSSETTSQRRRRVCGRRRLVEPGVG